MRMNPGIKKLWTTALRSGEYRQGLGYLRRGDEYCCWGVLCKLAVDAGVIPSSVIYPGDYYYYDDAYDLPSGRVIAWAEIDEVRNEGTPFLANGDTLENMNDTGISFNEIADTIDEEL